MAKIISLFNNKGGVSKTTTTFHLGWKLAEKGYRVLIVDTDPQCNLTGLCLSTNKHNRLEDFYANNSYNIVSALSPVFNGDPVPLKATECYSFEKIQTCSFYPVILIFQNMMHLTLFLKIWEMH